MIKNAINLAVGDQTERPTGGTYIIENIDRTKPGVIAVLWVSAEDSNRRVPKEYLPDEGVVVKE